MTVWWGIWGHGAGDWRFGTLDALLGVLGSLGNLMGDVRTLGVLIFCRVGVGGVGGLNIGTWSLMTTYVTDPVGGVVCHGSRY